MLNKYRRLRLFRNTNIMEEGVSVKVVGYIRVSTSRQGEEGISLDEQAHMLRGYADDRKLDLLTIEEDDRSAAGARGHLSRPGLQQAIRIAKMNGAAILVPSVDRLARHPGVLPDLLEAGVPVVSVAERRRLGRQALKTVIDRAQRERDLISQRVRQGAARARKRGIKLGNPTNLDTAQRNGAISNVARADRKVHELADFIEGTPGWDEMTLREKVELVNCSGPHNLVSEKRNERRPWTMSSIRKPLKRAEEELLLRKEMEDEPVTIAPSWSWVEDVQEKAGSVANQDVCRSSSDDDLSEEAAYKDLPGFGRF